MILSNLTWTRMTSSNRKKLVFCVVLAVLVGVYCMSLQCNSLSLREAFSSPMTTSDVIVLHETLGALVSELNRINATYFITSGTLLGSYRHHGLIPWDDDADIIVSVVDKQRVYDALNDLAPEYLVHTLGKVNMNTTSRIHSSQSRPIVWIAFNSFIVSSRRHWKFYPTSGSQWIPFRRYRWPFIDILFFDGDDEYIWNESPSHIAQEKWPRAAVFPLRQRPYAGLWLPAPCDTAAVLAINFNTSLCATRQHSHIYDIRMLLTWPTVVPCDRLEDIHPFVRRTSDVIGRHAVGDVVETLVFGDTKLATVIVRTGCDK